MVRRGEKVTVDVPVQVTGEIAPATAMLDQQLVQIPVEAEATNIPPGIEVDVEGLEVGHAVHAGDLQAARGRRPCGRPRDAGPARDRADAEQIEAELGEAEAEGAEAAPEAPEALADRRPRRRASDGAADRGGDGRAEPR